MVPRNSTTLKYVLIMTFPILLGSCSVTHPLITAVPYWGQTRRILSTSSRKWDCRPKTVNLSKNMCDSNPK